MGIERARARAPTMKTQPEVRGGRDGWGGTGNVHLVKFYAVQYGGHAVYKFTIGKSDRESERERKKKSERDKKRIYYECAGISGLFD